MANEPIRTTPNPPPRDSRLDAIERFAAAIESLEDAKLERVELPLEGRAPLQTQGNDWASAHAGPTTLPPGQVIAHPTGRVRVVDPSRQAPTQRVPRDLNGARGALPASQRTGPGSRGPILVAVAVLAAGLLVGALAVRSAYQDPQRAQPPQRLEPAPFKPFALPDPFPVPVPGPSASPPPTAPLPTAAASPSAPATTPALTAPNNPPPAPAKPVAPKPKATGPGAIVPVFGSGDE